MNVLDSQDDYCEDEENIEFDWLIPNDNANPEKVLPEAGLFTFLLNFLFISSLIIMISYLLLSFPKILVFLPFPQPIFKFLRMMPPYQRKQILHLGKDYTIAKLARCSSSCCSCSRYNTKKPCLNKTSVTITIASRGLLRGNSRRSRAVISHGIHNILFLSSF